jgi:hypothetical protein
VSIGFVHFGARSEIPRHAGNRALRAGGDHPRDPAVAVVTTLVDVIVRDRDPAQEDVPTVFFPAKEAER